MAEYPYINTTGKLQEFLEMIAIDSVPESATTKWLPKVGFKSNNHRPIIKIMKFIGFLDGNKPTQRWELYRDSTQAKQVMAEGIAEGYSDLFIAYQDAPDRSNSDLKNFFKGKMPKGGEQVISSTVNTFKTLCSFADFSKVSGSGFDITDNGNRNSKGSGGALVKQPDNIESAAPALHIDVQVHISADASETQIDKIFESMAKHLYGKTAE